MGRLERQLGIAFIVSARQSDAPVLGSHATTQVVAQVVFWIAGLYWVWCGHFGTTRTIYVDRDTGNIVRSAARIRKEEENAQRRGMALAWKFGLSRERHSSHNTSSASLSSFRGSRLSRRSMRSTFSTGAAGGDVGGAGSPLGRHSVPTLGEGGEVDVAGKEVPITGSSPSHRSSRKLLPALRSSRVLPE